MLGIIVGSGVGGCVATGTPALTGNPDASLFFGAAAFMFMACIASALDAILKQLQVLAKE